MVGYAGLAWVALAPPLAVWARRPVAATTALTAGTVWAADLVAIGLKAIFARARPFELIDWADPLLGATVGSSLPSGHAATSAAGAVMLPILVRRAVPALAALAVLISFSRVYVGVHYPLDVAAGAAIGAVVAVAVAAALRGRRRPSGGRPRSGEARTLG